MAKSGTAKTVPLVPALLLFTQMELALHRHLNSRTTSELSDLRRVTTKMMSNNDILFYLLMLSMGWEEEEVLELSTHDHRTLHNPSMLLICQRTYGEVQAVKQKERIEVKGSTQAVAKSWLKQARPLYLYGKTDVLCFIIQLLKLYGNYVKRKH